MGTEQVLRLQSWPRTILHMDADSFFASVEQAVNPELKDQPIITGAERGIVTSASIEAKHLGIHRGMRAYEVARLFPQCLLINSDYESYGLYSRHMFDILRRYTPDVEEYSIDEAFADLTGTRRLHQASYEEIGRRIQKDIQTELDISVSVGISLTKSLAKLASKFRKPAGLVSVPGREIHQLLGATPLEKIWGVGPNTAALLRKHHCKTALDVVQLPLYTMEKLLGKVGAELWHDLRGDIVYAINTEAKTSYASIQKTLTFTPASQDRKFVFAQLLRNVERALAKARRFHLASDHFSLFLKDRQFQYHTAEVRLPAATTSPLDVAGPLREAFNSLFSPLLHYRTTGITLHNLAPAQGAQLPLFGDPERPLKTAQAAIAMDEIQRRFGRDGISLAPTLHLRREKTSEHVFPGLHKLAV